MEELGHESAHGVKLPFSAQVFGEVDQNFFQEVKHRLEFFALGLVRTLLAQVHLSWKRPQTDILLH